MTREYDVIDKNGKRVRRDGPLQDGDRLTAKMIMMDAANPALAQAVATAEAIRRAGEFDRGLHPQANRYGKTDAAALSAREARDQRMRDAWKNPPSVTKLDTVPAPEHVAVVGPSAPVEQLQAARDQALVNRDKRLENAWQR